ncbi:MFS transporter [Chloroflexota bacterium]
MPKSQGFKKIINQWGGTTATFFAYTHLSHDLCTGLLPSLLPLIKIGLGISYLQSGLLLSAFSITSGLSQFLGGWVGDRINPPIAIAIGLGGVSLGAFMVGLSSSYYPLLIIMVVMGIVSGAYHPSATSFISNFFGGDRRGKAIALHMVGGSIGFSLGPLAGGLIAEALGWHFAYIILSIPTFLAAVLVFTKFRGQTSMSVNEPSGDITDEHGVTKEPVSSRLGLGQVLKPVAVVTILTILTQFVAGSAMGFLPIYLVVKHSINPARATMFMGLVRGGGIIGSLFGGWLSDWWTRKNAILFALMATGPILYLITLLPFNPAFVVVLMLFGLLMYMRQATIQPLLMDSVPTYLRATVFGIYFGLSMEGTSLMQPIAGHFMDVFGIVNVFQIIAFISIGLSLIAPLILKMPRLKLL